MTKPPHSYRSEQEDARGDASRYPMVVKSTVPHPAMPEGESTAPNSASSSPLSFNQTGMNESNSNHNLSTTNHESWGNNSSVNNSIYSDKLPRGPLSPQSAPPITTIPATWNSASASNTPVPSVIHTEAGGEGGGPLMRTKTHASTPNFPSIDRSGSGNMSMGSVSSSSNLLTKRTSTKVTGKKKHQTTKLKKSGSNTILTQSTNSPRPHDTASAGSSTSGVRTTGQKKQRRLERNRLSAQLSRRRRKQYLEELEERVVKLSLDMDSGRRAHAFGAIDRISEMRRQVLASAEAAVSGIERSCNKANDSRGNNEALMLKFEVDNSLRLLEKTGPLSRTSSDELLILNSFLGQQLKSFSLPSQSKFILWLTLQGDIFYRGGRAASERLSAARIGEKMLASGTDKVTPANAMWPLICNEVGLSYELEERLRVYQRTKILQDKSTWLDRHTARSSALVMQSLHDTVGGMAHVVGRRESEMTQGILTPTQRVKFLAWADKNSTRIKERLQARRRRAMQQKQDSMNIKAGDIDIGSYVDPDYSLNGSHHLAANLYILNHQLQGVSIDFPYQSPPLLTPAVLKKLMRRASFESLGQQKDTDNDSFTSSGSMKSFASNGSLIKSSSNLSLAGSNDLERPAVLNQITPQVGEQAAVEVVDQAIGFVKRIIPHIPKPTVSVTPAVHASAPTSSSTIGSSKTQDMKTTIAMDYHNHHLAPTAVSSYVATAPSTSAPPSNHVQQVPHYKDIVMHHAPAAPPTQLNVHNYAAPPPSTYPSSQVHENYQQPQQPLAQQYYPPQQQIHYAPSPMEPSQHLQSMASTQHTTSAPVYETSSSVIGQQQPHPVMRSGHVRKSSFLPPHLNVVPEDMFPGVEGTPADFLALQDIMDDSDDWGIGIGIDMDTTA